MVSKDIRASKRHPGLRWLGTLMFVTALLLSASAFGQTNTGRISGTVTDSSGAAVPDCDVQATDAGTGIKFTVKTAATGSYVFPSLRAGAYNVRVEAAGFRAAEDLGVVLDAASHRTVDFKLTVGAVSESISVVATLQQVQTASGDVARVIDDTQLSQIALNGRNYNQLLRLVPGAIATSLDPMANRQPGLPTTMSRMNAVRTNSINFSLDGGNNLDEGNYSNQVVNPSVDAIAEVKTLTSSYSAEFGGYAGAIINVVTKSGTGSFHGSAYEFVRNDRFDARSFFAQKVEPLRFNNFGWTLGGPLYIPKTWNTEKSKLFFFYSQEFKYFRQGSTKVNLVPTAAERNGDFRGSTLPAPVDPLTGQPFPDRVVPASRWSKNGPLLLKLYPAPNFAGPGGNYSITATSITDPREELIRLDYNLSPKTQIMYRWTHDEWEIMDAYYGGTNLGISPGTRSRPGYVTLASVNHMFSPTMLNSFSVGVTHNVTFGIYLNKNMTRASMGLTFPELYPANRGGYGPDVAIAGFPGYGAIDRVAQVTTTFQWRDDFTKVVGPHTLKFGVQALRSRRRQNSKSTDEGNVTFNTSARNTTKNVIADVLLGNFQRYWEDEADVSYWGRSSQFEFYAQDSWRASRRLNLELGLRYNLIPGWYDALGQSATFSPQLFSAAKAPRVSSADGSIVPGTGDPYNGIAILGSAWPDAARGRVPQAGNSSLSSLFKGLPRGGSETNLNNWGPRLGIAYDVFGNGKTSIRGGLGVFYDRTISDVLAGLMKNPPFISQANVYDGNIDNPTGGTARSFPSNLTLWPSRLASPRIVSYNLGVQKEIHGNIIAEVNYVGNLGRHLQRFININQLPVGTRLNAPNSGINPNALRPYPGYATIEMRDHGDNSNYNSLQASLSRRMRSGVSFGANYTFSRALDTTAEDPQNSYDARADYGLAKFHRKHVFNINYVYELPFLARHSNLFVRKILGGWELSGVTSFQSGAPGNVTVPQDVARIGAGSSRASVNGSPNLPAGERTLARWFNAEAFLPPEKMVQGQFGNTGRNILIGPGFQLWDISLMKRISIRERTRLQFRAESFNTFNHPNFTGINTTVRFNAVGQPTQNFGAVNGAGPGRVLSFGLKLLF